MKRTNYFKRYSSLGDDRFLCHPVQSQLIFQIFQLNYNRHCTKTKSFNCKCNYKCMQFRISPTLSPPKCLQRPPNGYL